LRKTAMTRFLIYLFPAMVDTILAATLFVCSNRLADAGQSRTKVGVVFAAWAVVYILCIQVLAKFVTSRNAAKIITAANVLFIIISGVFVKIENIWAIYAALGVLAIGSAMFFLPFQVFMKAVEPDRHLGVVRSVALYTFSWSLGYAGGPFIAGYIYHWIGWQWCFALTSLLGLLIAVGIQLLKHHARYHPGEAVTPTLAGPDSCNGAGPNYHAMPDLAWLGWVVCGVGCLGIYAFLSLLPSISVTFSLPKSQVGSILALLYGMQALTGLSFIRSRTWMFRPGPVVGFTAFGWVGLACFGLSFLPALDGAEVMTVPWRTLGLYVSAAGYGVFSGSFYFGLVFYSLIHPERSARYVAVNETVVGICGLAGPILAGMLADQFGFAAYPIALTAMLTAVVVLQFIVLKRLAHRKTIPDRQKAIQTVVRAG
jgi:MFS family permease